MILSMVGYHPVKNEKEAVHSARATRSARRINHRQQSGPLCFESSYMIKGLMVDEEDIHFLSECRWYLSKTKTGILYVKGYSSKGKWIYLHRLIVGARKNQEVDHIDGNRLNNKKSNLRFCTRQQNLCNMKKPKTNTSGYKGVTWHKANGKWQAQIAIGGNHAYLGSFSDPCKAHEAYKKAAIKIAGEFARW